MFSLFLFIGCAFILCAEGRTLVALLAAQNLTTREQWALGFPVGVLLNALLFFLYTILGISLTAFSVFFGHLYLIAMLGALYYQSKPRSLSAVRLFNFSEFSRKQRILFWILLISVLIKLAVGISSVLIYPSYYYDSISQWNMRARISYEDQAIAFDRDEVRGLSKPQYPILLHSLQIFFVLPQEEWNDVLANTSTFLFTLCGLYAFFLLLARRNGFLFSLLTVAVLLMIPLLSHHLTQGQGDIHVLIALLLSSVLLLHFMDERSASLLLLSALFVAETAWIKLDGLIFGVLPWLAIVAIIMCTVRRFRTAIAVWGLFPAAFVGGMWSVYLLYRGLPLSPHHGSDFLIELHMEAIPEVLRALFASGSFGVHWYAVGLGLGLGLLFLRQDTRWRRSIPELMICLWGLILFFGTLFIFLATPNVSFLLNAQTFSRTMLLPLSLLILGVLLLLQKGIAGRAR